MLNVFDIAENILSITGPISAMKLQKLVYYCQAWSLVWDDKPLFDENIEAWVSGPVIRELYEAHRGQFQINPGDFNDYLSGNDLDSSQKDTIKEVVKSYGGKSAQWLSDQTHSEFPWKNARIGLSDSERGNTIISNESISEYYSSLSK